MKVKSLYYIILGLCLAGLLLASPIFGQTAAVLEDHEPYRIRTYDVHGYNYPLWVPGTGSAVSYANVYPVTAEYGEELSKVVFHTLVKDTDFDIWAIPDYRNVSSLSSGGTLVAWGKVSQPGRYTVDLDSPIKIEKDTKFALVVTLSAFSRQAIATDSTKAGEGKGSVSEPGQAFVLLSGGWADLHSYQRDTALCLEAWITDSTPSEPPKMSVEDMKADLEHVLADIRARHVVVKESGFTLTQLDVIASVRERISEPLSNEEFYFQMQRIFAMFRESRTELAIDLQEKFYLNIPFMWLMQDGPVVTEDVAPLVRGDRILSIGGKTPDEIIEALWSITSSDNEYWVRYVAPSLLRRGSYLTHLGLVGKYGTVTVEILRDSETLVYDIPTVSSLDTRGVEITPVQWHIEKDADLGYLRIDDFPPVEEMEPIKAALSDFFAAVRESGVSNVVFDFRYTNGRYSSINSELLGYLDKGPVYQDGYVQTRIDTKPQSSLFKGHIYVLTSNKISGATVIMTVLLHDNGLAVTVGEPTGQAPVYRSSNEGTAKLPVTGRVYRIATMQMNRPRGRLPGDRYLAPDIPAYTSIEDLLAGRDAQMERVQALIASGFTPRAVGLQP